MTESLESRLARIEDRLALQDAVTAYCTAVDSLSDIEGLLNCFTDDAVLDLRGLNLPLFKGRKQIRGFFEQVFADMSHHAHYNTNFVLEKLESNRADVRAYVIGHGATPKGKTVLAHVRYQLAYLRTEHGWKMTSFSEAALMPLPAEVTEIHGRD